MFDFRLNGAADKLTGLEHMDIKRVWGIRYGDLDPELRLYAAVHQFMKRNDPTAPKEDTLKLSGDEILSLFAPEPEPPSGAPFPDAGGDGS